MTSLITLMENTLKGNTNTRKTALRTTVTVISEILFEIHRGFRTVTWRPCKVSKFIIVKKIRG